LYETEASRHHAFGHHSDGSSGSESPVTTHLCLTAGLPSKAESAAHPEESGSSQRSYWGTDLTNTYAKGSYRQRISHFTEELSFLSESNKNWVMGRAIVQRLKWT